MELGDDTQYHPHPVCLQGSASPVFADFLEYLFRSLDAVWVVRASTPCLGSKRTMPFNYYFLTAFWLISCLELALLEATFTLVLTICDPDLLCGCFFPHWALSRDLASNCPDSPQMNSGCLWRGDPGLLPQKPFSSKNSFYCWTDTAING